MKQVNRYFKSFVRKFNLTNTSLKPSEIRKIIESYGFEIVEFNNEVNNDAGILLKALDINAGSLQTDGFTFYDKDHKIVFVREHLSREDELLVLLHEAGHIYMDHLFKDGIASNTDTAKENEAAYFAIQVKRRLDRNERAEKAKSVILNSAIPIAACICLIVLIILTDRLSYRQFDKKAGSGIVSSETVSAVLFDDESSAEQTNSESSSSIEMQSNIPELCYWTESGEVYHLYKDCQHIRDSVEVFSGTTENSGKERCCKTCLSRTENERETR